MTILLRLGEARGWLLRAVLVCCALALSAHAREARVVAEPAVASAHPLATRAGLEVIDRGGNAFDAAIAVAAALAVVEPFSSGIGGGGFFLLHRAADRHEEMLDAREVAPLAATRDMYLQADGKPDTLASLEGARAAAIPGLPAGLAWLAKNYGKLPLRQSLAPAIELAQDGFVADERYHAMVRIKANLLARTPEAATIFLADTALPPPGFRLLQPELASTLRALALRGHAGFYTGAVARELVESVREAGGIWSREDLARYRVKSRKPIKFTVFNNVRITTASPPSSGGVVLAQSLHMLEALMPRTNAADHDHLIAEALRRSFRDRARYLGDPDFVAIPMARLLSKDYAVDLTSSIDASRATPSADLDRLNSGARRAVNQQLAETENTTHFSVVDRAGNRVAATLSINGLFGSGVVAGRTGVLLNNEMDDFSVSPGTPNLYGLVGSSANAIAAGKRPLSSMSPTFVEDERGVLVVGTPGGSRIISMVMLAILDHIADAPADPARTVGARRFHHQYLPDQIEIEPDSFAPEWVRSLEAKGHRVKTAERKWGNMQAVFIDRRTGNARAASDPRGAAAWQVSTVARDASEKPERPR